MSRYNDLDPTPRTYRATVTLPKDIKVSELAQFCRDHNLGEDAFIPGGHVVANKTETPEQVDARLTRTREAQRRHREWVRAQYERLFGGEEASE